MADNKTLEMIINEIETGNVQVLFSGWSFTGGRSFGDSYIFDLVRGNKKCGYAEDNNSGRVEVELDKQNTWLYETDPVYQKVIDTVAKAFFRDDKEVVEKITYKGDRYMPCGNGDISREDVLTGRWKISDTWEDVMTGKIDLKHDIVC